MELKERYVIPASPATVWAALTDSGTLAACLPGCESIARIAGMDFGIRITATIGPLRARFSGTFQWSEIPALPGYAYAGQLTGEAQGGTAGFARGKCGVQLAGKDQTEVTLSADAGVGGRLAQIGDRIIDASMQKLASDFFGALALRVPRDAEAPARRGQPGLGPRAKDGPPSAKEWRPSRPLTEEGLTPQIWLAGLLGIVFILLIVFSLVL